MYTHVYKYIDVPSGEAPRVDNSDTSAIDDDNSEIDRLSLINRYVLKSACRFSMISLFCPSTLICSFVVINQF
jgi:hypothetical protein